MKAASQLGIPHRNLSNWLRSPDAVVPKQETRDQVAANDHNGCALRDAAVLGRHLAARGVDICRGPEIDPSVIEGTNLRSPAGMSGVRPAAGWKRETSSGAGRAAGPASPSSDSA